VVEEDLRRCHAVEEDPHRRHAVEEDLHRRRAVEEEDPCRVGVGAHRCGTTPL
jgi:hypothetical protein